MRKLKVIIVGGGISGLATAIAMDKIGLDYIILEQAKQIKQVGFGLTIWSNGIDCLKKLDLGNKFEKKASSVDGISFHNYKGKNLAYINFSKFKKQHGIYASIIYRADLINILLQSVNQKKLILNSRVQSFLENSEGIIVKLSSEKEIRGDILIGADGIHSIVRKNLLDHRMPKYVGFTAWRGSVSMDSDFFTKKIGTVVMGPKALFGFFHLRDNKIYWFTEVTSCPDTGKTLNLESLKEAFFYWPKNIREIINRTSSDSMRRNDILDLPPIRNWGRGHCTLIGDAAHPSTPDLGQGANIGLEDAIELACFLRKYSDKKLALRMFEASRYTRVASFVKHSRVIGKINQWSHPLSRKLLDSAYSLFGNWLFKSSVKKYTSYRSHAKLILPNNF